jgi:hypothetical protein
MADITAQHESPQIRFERHENFESWYANNVQMFQNDFDLRLVFGELDSQPPTLVIRQHTAMTMSWLQAKLMHHFLTVHIGAYELTHGKIPVPPDQLPPEPQPPSREYANNPAAGQVYEYLKKVREQFIESLK